MFQLNEKYEVVGRIVKCDYIRYSPAETSTKNTPNSQIYIFISRNDSVKFLLNSCFELNCEVTKKVTIPDMQTVMIYDWLN